MKRLAEILGCSLVGFCWLAGIILAKGFWSTFFTITIPFYAWYLVVERLMVMAGIK